MAEDAEEAYLINQSGFVGVWLFFRQHHPFK